MKIMIKVVIYSAFGAPVMTKGMEDLIENNKDLSFVELRMKLAEYIESRAVSAVPEEGLSSHPEMFVKIHETPDGDTLYACWDHRERRIRSLSVDSVDENCRWGISEYDGAESVKYFKEPEVIDAKYNYCQWL